MKAADIVLADVLLAKGQPLPTVAMALGVSQPVLAHCLELACDLAAEAWQAAMETEVAIELEEPIAELFKVPDIVSERHLAHSHHGDTR